MKAARLLYTVLGCLLLTCLISQAFAQKTAAPWKPLFNGKDLKNWDTYLKPSSAATDQAAIGLNRDPHQVFTVTNGTLRISGQDWGGIATQQSFSNYHLRFEVKWGEQKWPPREQAKRDGGLLFHCSEPYDYGSKCWMRSIELQIQEADMADCHNVGAGTALFQLSKTKDGKEEVQQYDPFADFMPYTRRVCRSGNFESPAGSWTTGELVARGADAVFIINGFVVNRVYTIFRTDLHEPVTAGRIQFQSEGSEHYLKNIELRSIPPLPAARPLLSTDKANTIVIPGQPQHFTITNNGEAVELIAVELLGKNIDQFNLQLPAFPLVLKKGESITIQAAVKEGTVAGNTVQLKLETLQGPVPGFTTSITSSK
jgi:hypothetical protein